ncbi:MAG: RNA methyltransferase [Clostridia bacterium]|nr:RNA methyltransferase [Clostridia bacterium]
MIISSKSNPIIKKVASLSDKKYRKTYGEFIVESVKAVDECLASGMNVTQIICTAEFAGKYPTAIIVTDELFVRISTEKAPQGVLAVVKTPVKPLSKPSGNCLLLDRVQDPGNLGTIIRTANGAGFNDIYLIDCTDAYSPKAIRASMGGVFYVNVYEGSYDEVFEVLKGVPVICADMSGDDVFSFPAPSQFCLCIGNEGNGVSDMVSAKSNYTVSIPMRDTCESLNAAVSAAIAMYALKNNQKGV